MTIAAILLAAGRSTRFGAEDKLAVPLSGLPIGLHVARTIASLPFAARFVVTNLSALEWKEFEVLENEKPEAGIAHSIAIGIAAAQRAGVDAALIALADMPFVPSEHFGRLMACYRGADSLAASSDGVQRLPPALFGANWFGTLGEMTGDQGAHMLLEQAELVTITPQYLKDIDRPEDIPFN